MKGKLTRALAALAALAALIVLLLAGAAMVYAVGSTLIAARPAPAGAMPQDLAGETVQIPSASGAMLSGWFAPGHGRGAVVLLHNLHGSRNTMLERARLLHRAGYAVLLFDFQASGESSGRYITFGHLESRDAQAAVAYLRQRMPGQKIGAIGRSLGGAAAILAQPPLAVDALVLEAVYPTLEQAVADRLALRLGSWATMLGPLLTLQVEPRLGFPASALRPIDGVAALRMPKLFIAGEADRHTRIEDSQALFQAAGEPKALWTVPGAAHVDFQAFAPAEYEKRVLGFLDSTLR